MNKSNIKSVFLSVAISFILVTFMFCALGCENKEEKEYNETVTELNSSKESLNNKINDAESLCKSINDSMVTNNDTITELKKETDNAKQLNKEIEVPSEKPDSKDFKAQTELMHDYINKLNNETNLLSQKINNVNQSKEDKANEASNLKERFNASIKDNKGYEIQTIVKTTDYFKATDSSKINFAWKKAGGKENAPDISNMRDKAVKNLNGYNKENCIVLIGSATFNNLTKDFTPNNQSADLYIHFANNESSLMGGHFWDSNKGCTIHAYLYTIEYSDGAKTNLNDFNLTSTPFITTKLNSSSSGSIPFMIVLDNAFNPNYPNGNPELNELLIGFGGNNSYFKPVIVS